MKSFLVTCEAGTFWAEAKFKIFVGYFRITFGIILGILGRMALLVWWMLLLKYPSIFTLCSFSQNGPSKEEVESVSFKMWFIGHGFSNESLAANGNSKPVIVVITRITGPKMGYVTTLIIMIPWLLYLSAKETIYQSGDFTLYVLCLVQLFCNKDFNKMEYHFISSWISCFHLDLTGAAHYLVHL